MPAQIDVMDHYLRVGNRNHLRSFGRSLIRPLIEMGLDEAAAVLDGATNDQPEFNEMITTQPSHIDTAHARLGPVYDTAFARGAAMADDELVAYLDATVGAAGPEGPSAESRSNSRSVPGGRLAP